MVVVKKSKWEEISMEIKIEPNIELSEIPLSISLKEGACLRDALLMATPQVINKETGEYIDDPDFWDIRLNEVAIYHLKAGLDTKMNGGDVIRLKILYHLS
ncbi:MAG: hypothetical protein C0392_13070 [Syntrophus sp. (in: bacteria)]|nr:hypothetical protein [Syntrophus sp. (in: bacteria)]